MYLKVKNVEFIRNGNEVAKYIDLKNDSTLTTKILKGLSNSSLVTIDTQFKFVDTFKLSDTDRKMFFVLENKELGIFIVREDNVEVVESSEDVLNAYGFSKLFKTGNKTILLDGKKRWMTTKHAEDVDDPEKAVMILLLKAEGYNIQDIYKIVELIK